MSYADLMASADEEDAWGSSLSFSSFDDDDSDYMSRGKGGKQKGIKAAPKRSTGLKKKEGKHKKDKASAYSDVYSLDDSEDYYE